MTKRKKNSGGQAIVMVTVALVAMAGMIGLAVDLGWSFFIKKQAQVAADGAAMAAVQEAYGRLGGQFASPVCGATKSDVWCSQDKIVGDDCSAILAVGNSNPRDRKSVV
jgi:Flp pilus assembly protein TadG